MHLSNWLVFCGVAFLVCFSPGPGVLLAISNAMAHGKRDWVASSLGNATGLFIISGVAMAGMGAILAVSALAFTILKVAGALYLIYLGIRQWRSQAVSFAAAESAAGSVNKATGAPASRKLYGQGMGVALTNPKAILFFSALFPQFITADAPVFEQVAVLTCTFVAMSLLSHLFYVLVARMFKGQLTNPLKQRLFNRVSGGLFVVLGLSLLRLKNKVAA
ncbi:LysE family translocator [Rhodoferax saidenbachensis]|uniref:Threonine/homoserine/homoserine lactone efflux protein n=1 Tax=Rhodoferax saidenbachensis TaxID=1484693 RepID=A0ABU1ZJ65_9BURK|nr:LysE family translocator [Rhodoferax saidenbachensis]MDR7305418.1 threonine/homoserine/homoserine lactone efflux protein [Rhodoferax saidenbachensis]